MGIERCVEVSAIQYQDFFRQGSINSKEAAQNRVISFPKLLLFELVDYPCEYPKYYIRIYEKKALDAKLQSKNIYLYLKGTHVPVAETEPGALKVDYMEVVSSVEAFFGSRANYVLT